MKSPSLSRAVALVAVVSASATSAISLPAQTADSPNGAGTYSDSVEASLILLPKPIGCVASLPSTSMHRVRVFLDATIPESSGADFKLEADLMAQEVAAELRKSLGATGDSIPIADTSLVWYSVPTALIVVAHKNGEMSARPIGTSGDSAAAMLLLHAYNSARAQSEAFIAWPDGRTEDSLVLHLVLRPDYVGANPNRVPPGKVIRKFAAFYLAEPERVFAFRLPDRRTPVYPLSSAQHRVGASVLLHFVVDSAGQVERETIHDLWPDDKPRPTGSDATAYDEFARSAKSWARDLRFSPARIGACPVEQVALLPLRFVAPGRP